MSSSPGSAVSRRARPPPRATVQMSPAYTKAIESRDRVGNRRRRVAAASSGSAAPGESGGGATKRAPRMMKTAYGTRRIAGSSLIVGAPRVLLVDPGRRQVFPGAGGAAGRARRARVRLAAQASPRFALRRPPRRDAPGGAPAQGLLPPRGRAPPPRPPPRPLPLDAAAEEHLVGRARAAVHVAGGPVETDAGDVVLAAGVRAAADLDAQVGGRLDQVPAAVAGRSAQGALHRKRQLARAGDGDLAGLGPGARRRIGQSPRLALSQADDLERPVHRRELFALHPAQEDVLVLRRAYGAVAPVLGDAGDRLELFGGDVAARQGDEGHRVAALPLRPGVGRR